MFPKNLHAPVFRCQHADLVRASDSSCFRSICPACKQGLLLVRRDMNALERFHRIDRCTLCGQLVWYTDKAGPHGERFSEAVDDLPHAGAS